MGVPRKLPTITYGVVEVHWQHILHLALFLRELYFIHGLTNSHMTLQFTSEVSETTVNFPDVHITKDASGVFTCIL